jgi:predicted metal-dependent phosphoesterase TrpH
MTTKIKTTLLTGLFFFGLLTALQAQEKYEFATLKFDLTAVGKYTISLSTDNNEFKEIAGEFPSNDRKISNIYNTAPALKWIKDNGWEIVEFHPIAYQKTYNDFLLKKRKQ